MTAATQPPRRLIPAAALAPVSHVEPARVTAIMEKVRQIEIRTRGLVAGSIAGGYRAAFRGRGIDFDRVREYVAGDEVRTIDWNVTARAGHPFVKQFREERELTLMLLVDVSASGEFGSTTMRKRELAAELACVLAMSAIRNSDRVGLVLFSDRIERFVPVGKGRLHALRVVREILGCTPEGRGTDVAAAVRFAGQVQTRRALMFVISDLELGGIRASALADLQRALRPVARAHDVIALHVRDPHERELPDVGLVTVEDAETGEVVSIDTGRKQVRARFAELARTRSAEITRMLRRDNVEICEIDTAAPYVPTLLALFSGRERRAR
ncbi:MAG TPA: DUF58 domain-containing protein [Kofleriaceae bacterium]|nr:DUF58 domain-containing protein [Kofleriaceae bacterium]